jgi:hypothetical protein
MGHILETKTNEEYNQDLLHLFGLPCPLIGPHGALVITTSSVSLLWQMQQFFNLKF